MIQENLLRSNSFAYWRITTQIYLLTAEKETLEITINALLKVERMLYDEEKGLELELALLLKLN